jgi:16S rRNA (cytosine967-C5)-methyltransferase
VPQTSARRAALDALRRWRTRRQFADSIIADLFARTSLPSAERAFALELFYGVLRNLSLLDYWITQLRPARIDVDLRDLLRLGVYQLFIAETSEHAAVHETVDLAGKRHRSITNAVLRSAIRGKQKLRASVSNQPLEIQTSHPEFLIARWERQFGAEAAKSLCLWNNRPPPIYARINHLRTDRKAFFNAIAGVLPLKSSPNFVEIASLPAEALKRGDCYVQDPSTAIACELLSPQPREKVLDACSAPGGKAGYLAEIMQNSGVLVACDRDTKRLRLLKQNLTVLGVRIAKIVAHDWTQSRIPPAIRAEAPFDRILLDAPCSNTGVMRRRVDVRWRLTPTDFARMQKLQIEISSALVPLLRPGGMLVYSTCSVEREENEEVVKHISRKASTLRLEEQKTLLPFRDRFDGAFAAKFRKIE